MDSNTLILTLFLSLGVFALAILIAHGVTLLTTWMHIRWEREMWRKEYNTFRPHSSLGYRPPATGAFLKTFIVTNRPEMISSPKGISTLKALT
jgi:Integrase core domain